MSLVATRIEQIAVAVFAKLEGLKDQAIINTCSRRLLHVNEWDVAYAPAAFQHQTSLLIEPARGGLSKLVMKLDWYFYIGNDNESTDLNNIVGAALVAMKPSPAYDKQTLDGVVENAYIDGNVELYEGVLQDRAVAIVPITIVAPV